MYWRKILLTLLPLLALFLLVIPGGVASAKTLEPATVDCTGFCFSWTGWNGNTFGASAQIETTGRTMTFHTNTGTLQRFLGAWGASNANDIGSRIHVGEEVDMPGNGQCGAFHNYEAAYYFAVGFNTAGNSQKTFCWDMPDGDANHPAVFKVSPYVNGGGGMLVQVTGWSHESFSGGFPYSGGMTHSFASMGLQEQIDDILVGHDVWGVYESNWQYAHSDGSLYFQQRAKDFLVNNYPPQIIWVHDASPNYLGGQSMSCDYGDGTTCVHGG